MVTRRVVQLLLSMALACGGLLPNLGHAEDVADAAAVKSRFEHLSQHGNVQCSVQFEHSIASMPNDAKASRLLLRSHGRSPLPAAVGWAQEVFRHRGGSARSL